MRDIRFLLKKHYTNSRALIIGINQYKNAPPLSYAVSDAEEIRNVLIGEFSFPEENITYLIDEDATKKAISKAFSRYMATDIDLDDRIIVFFAGHGRTLSGIRGEVGCLVPYDGDIDDYSTFIRWDEFTRNSELIRAKHMLFIMDACYSGLALNRSLHPGSARFLKDMMLRYSRQVLTAGKADEVVSDSGGPLPNHSVFTGHLIEGLRGKATVENGIITANGLMAYVYGKVASDRNSNQTPHYGHFDGDGDFVLQAPQLAMPEESEEKDTDRLIVIPFPEEIIGNNITYDNVKKVKSLLASDSLYIELHDFIIEQIKHLMSLTGEDKFSVRGRFSNEELLERISRYEEVAGDLSVLTACIAYWARTGHEKILHKIFSRLTDQLESNGGLSVWINLRWYPLIIIFYCSGIACVNGNRYDSLANIFFTKDSSPRYRKSSGYFVEAISIAISELYSNNIFKCLPGHERNYVPMSEYLFKLLQPKLDDALFIGKSYEDSFDEFEVLFGLVVADIYHKRGRSIRGPIGRFGWKQKHGDEFPLARVIEAARSAGDDWEPIKAGLFGRSFARFDEISNEYLGLISRLGWY